MGRTIKQSTGINWIKGDLQSLFFQAQQDVSRINKTIQRVEGEVWEDLDLHTEIVAYIELQKKAGDAALSVTRRINELYIDKIKRELN